MIGQLNGPDRYVHVIDDFTLDTVIRTVDTVADFAQYIERKEEFVRSGKLALVAGEENLLAYYFRRVDEDGRHYFECPTSADALVIDDGLWTDFSKSPERLSQIDADRISYHWDGLIERFAKNVLEGTQFFPTEATVGDTERALRFMAAEPRLHRRMLAKSLLEILERGDQEWRAARVAKPLRPGEPHYVFLSLQPHEERSYDEYRIVRLDLLRAYCLVTRLQDDEALDVVGIATEPLSSRGRSEDFLYLDGRYWPDELAEEAANLQKDLSILLDVQPVRVTEHEYPIAWHQDIWKGRNRNKPCPCGSGRKWKKCHGAPTSNPPDTAGRQVDRRGAPVPRPQLSLRRRPEPGTTHARSRDPRPAQTAPAGPSRRFTQRGWLSERRCDDR